MSNTHAAELTASIAASIAALCVETDAARQSATYRAWLKTMSAFYQYSYGNQLLIWSQMPTATRVAGFHKWKSLKRSVNKGQKGIRILAPCIRKRDEETSSGATEKAAQVSGFRTVAVFDISQTSGEDLNELECNATMGGEELLPLMESAVSGLGISLLYKALNGPDGLSKGGAIEIEASLDAPARFGVLVHELAHELLGHKVTHATTTKQQRELEAESVAYAVLAHYGISLPSQFYLTTYDVTTDMLTAALQTISQTTKQIIGLLSPAVEQQNEEEDAETSGVPLAHAA